MAPILSGAKCQTIRADRKRHARIGERLQLYTAMRTKSCKLIGTSRCHSVQPIRIEVENAAIGFQTGRTLTTIDELDGFAQMDGFPDWASMRLFWHLNHPDVPIFSGVMIRWDDFCPAGGSGVMM